jgi:hypothetical protein
MVFKYPVLTGQKNTPYRFIKTYQLILYMEKLVVVSQIPTEHIHTLCGQNVKFLNVKLGGTYINNWALKCLQQRYF